MLRSALWCFSVIPVVESRCIAVPMVCYIPSGGVEGRDVPVICGSCKWSITASVAGLASQTCGCKTHGISRLRYDNFGFVCDCNRQTHEMNTICPSCSAWLLPDNADNWGTILPLASPVDLMNSDIETACIGGGWCECDLGLWGWGNHCRGSWQHHSHVWKRK